MTRGMSGRVKPGHFLNVIFVKLYLSIDDMSEEIPKLDWMFIFWKLAKSISQNLESLKKPRKRNHDDFWYTDGDKPRMIPKRAKNVIFKNSLWKSISTLTPFKNNNDRKFHLSKQVICVYYRFFGELLSLTVPIIVGTFWKLLWTFSPQVR